MNTIATVYIHSFSVIDADGITTRRGHNNWEDGQTGPQDIKRSQVLSRPYMAFGKLNLPDKLAFSAASLALRDVSVSTPSATALFLGIPEGSLSTDRAYRESIIGGNPSPALFSATLPSSPIADIAIYYHLKGPNVCFAGGDAPFIASIEYALLQLSTGQLEEVLVVFVDEQRAEMNVSETAPTPYATALFLSSIPPDFPATVITLERLETITEAPSLIENETTLIKYFFALLKKKESLRIPVSVGGFIGYISLQF